MANANEDTESSYIAPLVKESLLLDGSQGQNTLIVGERGHVLLAAPNTNEFVQVAVPVTTTLTAVTSLGSLAWIVGHDASILKSTDTGQTWNVVHQAPELDRPLLDIHFFDNKEGIAVGAYGLFYRSVDGGQTWSKESHASVLSEDDNAYLDSIKDDEDFYQEELSFISPHFNRLNDADGILYLAGEAGLVAMSEDRGQSWQRLDINYYGSFFDVAQLNSGHTIAVGLRGNIFVQEDEQWTRLETCVTTSLNTVVIDNDKVFALGNNGVLLSIDPNKFNNNESSDKNNEGCRTHASIAQIETNFSDAILDMLFIDNQVTAITAGGLKSVKVEE